VAEIRGLVRAAYAKWIPAIDREPLPMRADYERAVCDHRIDLLYLGEQLAALIETMPGSDHYFIENVAVAPDFQGRGLGRRLLAHAEEIAVAAGFREIRLLTNAAFRSNVTLYQSLGYRIDREEPFMGGITVFMSKPLRST
jgi:ribosomal protein S18 acetylase RimI-like enzyme